MKIGILVFDDAEELDFVGPWEVFKMAREARPDEIDLVLVAERTAPVRCRGGLRVLPDVATSDCKALDVLLVPGGQGTRREVKNEALL